MRTRFASVLLSPVIFFKRLCFWIGFLILLIAVCVAFMVFLFFHSLPDIGGMEYNQMRRMAREYVYERLENKKKMYRWVGLESVHRDLIYAVIMSEDADFFRHSGINFDAMINSLAENIKRREFAFGGSTISQQVARIIFLDNTKSIMRKLRELCITRRLERRFTKNEILELYLNSAEFGPDIFGVNAASHYYFKKPPSVINAAEGAFMALMLPSPRKNHYRLYMNRNLSGQWEKKLHRVLRDMCSSGFISERQYRSYLKYRYFPD